MATGGAVHGVPILPTPGFCEFLHSPCWLYPVISFFSRAIDEYGYSAVFGDPVLDRKQIKQEIYKILYETYCDLVGCILVAYHKDQQVDLSDVVKTAAMLCGEYKPIGLRQDVVNFIQATLNMEYFSYTMMCYINMFKIMCCHDMKRDIIQRDYEAKEMKALLKYLHDQMELILEEHKNVQKYFIGVKMPPELHNGPFLCCYGISLCDPDCGHESFLGTLLYLTNEISKSSVDRPQLIQHVVEMLHTVTVDEEKVDKHIKEITSEIPTTSIDVKSEVRRVKASLLKASLDQKLTVSDKILTITHDRKLQQTVLDITKQKVLSSDKSMAGKSKPTKELKLPEEKVAVSQNPPPDPNFRRGVWSRDTPANLQIKHLYLEFNYRNTKNLAYLSEPWIIQTSVENMCQLKAVVEKYAKRFEDKWPRTVSKEGEGRIRYSRSQPDKVLKESRHAITMLKYSSELY